MKRIFDILIDAVVSLVATTLFLIFTNRLLRFVRERSLVNVLKRLNRLKEYHENPNKFSFFVTHETAAIVLLSISATVCILVGNLPYTSLQSQNPNLPTTTIARVEVLCFMLLFLGMSVASLSKIGNLINLSSDLQNFEALKGKLEANINSLKNKLKKYS